jgi:hypothetical protein
MVAMAIQKSATMEMAGIQIAASDRDQGAIRITQSNASWAGVLNYIQVELCIYKTSMAIPSIQYSAKIVVGIEHTI